MYYGLILSLLLSSSGSEIITIDNEKGYNRNRDGIQTGNPHPYPNYPTMGIPLAAFIQYYREL